MQPSGPSWIWDESELRDPHGFGERAVKFVKLLKLHEGRYAGKPFPLQPWQERIIRRVYGDTKEDETRRVRTVFLYLPRANGKTSFAAALAGLHLFGPEREAQGQAIAAAADREQASIAYRALSGMIAQDANLQKLVDDTPSSKRIRHHKSRSEFKAISSEVGTKHGMSISFLLADEIHAWQGDGSEFWGTLRTSMGKRHNPLTIVATTAGVGVNNEAYRLLDYSRKVASGEIEDETWLPILFEAPADADWRDEKVWHAVNPAIAAGFRQLDEMRTTAKQAEGQPTKQEIFRRLYLNQWSDGAAEPWFDMMIYDQGNERACLDSRESEPAWIGVDLGSTSDLTAVTLAFRDDDGGFSVYPYVFAPEGAIRKRQDRGEAPYRDWAAQGFLSTTPGDVTDYDRIEELIRDLCKRFNVQEIALDPWGARPMINRFVEDGLPAIEHRQGFVSMTGPMKAMERAVLARKFRHGGNPILRWCVSNVVVDEDPAGNIKPNKKRAMEKIDAAVATIMAVGRADANEACIGSIYEDTTKRPHGILFI